MDLAEIRTKPYCSGCNMGLIVIWVLILYLDLAEVRTKPYCSGSLKRKEAKVFFERRKGTIYLTTKRHEVRQENWNSFWLKYSTPKGLNISNMVNNNKEIWKKSIDKQYVTKKKKFSTTKMSV